MSLPVQKVTQDERYSLSEKTGLNSIETTANHYLDSIIDNQEEEEIVRLYRMLTDEIDEEDYNYVLNPFNTKIKKYTRFRGRLRNFNIVAPVVKMRISEFGRREHYPSVTQTHPNDQNDKDKAYNQMLDGYQAQASVNALNELGIDTGRESVKQPPLEEAKEEFKRTYKASRVIEGQKALDYIIYDKDLADKYIELYLNFLVCGRPISYKGVNHNDIDFDVVHPLDYFFPRSVTKDRLEDRDWGIRRLHHSPSQVLDYHRGKLSKELIEILDELNNDFGITNELKRYSGHMFMTDDDFNNNFRQYYRSSDNSVEHYHIVFKSFKRIAILTYLNKLGEPVEMEVEDNYELNKEAGDISLEYDYKNALYETYKIIINAHEEFVGTREIPYDRAEVNNSSKIKLPFNGLAAITIDGDIDSMVKESLNYQVTYNVLKYAFEKMVNKNKDKLAVIPLGLINKGKQNWDEEKAMYFAEANSTLFIDETSPNAALAMQGIKVLDMSLGKYLKEVIEIADTVKQEWWDRTGFNRQRYGQTMASDGKAVTEQAIFRSSLINEEDIRQFEKFQEKDYAGLLDLSKYAWIDGVKGTYVTTSGHQALLDIPHEHFIYYLNSDMDVHVTFSGEEKEKREELKKYLFNATQNGMGMDSAIEGMESRSFTLLKEVIIKEEKARQALEQANKEAERENNSNIANVEAQTKQAENDTKKYVADKQFETAVTIKQMEIDSNNNTNEADELLDAIGKQQDLELKDREQNRKETETSSKIIKEKAEVQKLKKETSVITKDNKTNN